MGRRRAAGRHYRVRERTKIELFYNSALQSATGVAIALEQNADLLKSAADFPRIFTTVLPPGCEQLLRRCRDHSRRPGEDAKLNGKLASHAAQRKAFGRAENLAIAHIRGDTFGQLILSSADIRCDPVHALGQDRGDKRRPGAVP